MKKLLLLSCLIYISQISQSQTAIDANDIGAGKSLIEAYFSPFGNALGASLNNGWYNTAKPHKLGGFDLTFTLNTVLINNEYKSFDVKDVINGTNFSLTNNGDQETPTFLGSGSGIDLNYLDENGITQEFRLPAGISAVGAIPLPMLQGGVGLIKGTEIDIRYIPLTEIGKVGEINMFGIGFKHDILQWIPLASVLPISVSIQGGHTSVNTGIKIQEQDVELKVRANTFNLLVSKKILMLTGYAGVGYNSSTTTFTVNEKYSIGTGGNSITFDAESLSELKFETENDFRMNLGLRFQLAILAIQANYTLSKYPVATVGVGISIR
tara:strand:- start:124 stop:1095 length:972 start_codon:yes stop_codon:yes gene_type:complete